MDDDPDVLSTLASLLEDAGYAVETAPDGRGAAARLGESAFDVVVSDIAMADVNGVQLLRGIRERDADLPVILMTGGPELESAIEAVEYGALRYLLKPFPPDTLQTAVATAVRLHRMARWKREALRYLGFDDRQFGDLAALETSFARARGSLWLAGQPIVRAADASVYGMEVLARTDEPLLQGPGALFGAAERLGELTALGRLVRLRAAEVVPPPGVLLFVNVHAGELVDDELLDPEAPLSARASSVVLEVTERASLEQVGDLRERVRRLRSLGYRIAVDDLGAGYAGLTSFAALEPEVAKLDMSIIRGVDQDATRQRLVASIAELCRELGAALIAEGVETEEERRVLVDLGCELLQGFLFARPARVSPARPPA